MEELFGAGAVLFESNRDEEALRIECAVTREGGLSVLQESEGPLTQWCFEESPHRIEVRVEPRWVLELLDYFHLDEPVQLPAALRGEFTGYECGLHIRQLLRRIEVPYQVLENAPAR